MVGPHQEVDLLMALQNVSEKDVDLQNGFHLHVGTGPHLQSAHHVGLTTMLERIFKRGIAIGTRAIEVTLIARRKDITEAKEEGALPDIETGEVQVEATLAAQISSAIVTGIAAGALYEALAL
jgi:hypothetical protein